MASAVKVKTKRYTAKDFFMEDLPRTLFPLTTNKILVEKGSQELIDFAQKLIDTNGSFLPQRRVHANKDEFHLRRTVKLDAVAEFYLYHLIFKNRAKFRKPHTKNRTHYGYRFDDGRPISPSKSYSDFKSSVWMSTVLSEFIYFDIASYFNSVYHHDLHAWFAALAPDDKSDIAAFGKYFREINAGRSLDCLPHGLYPTKMIGNDFLRFIEDSSAIQSSEIIRFMDDVYFVDSDMNRLKADFAEVQRLLGLKGLSVNGSKTLAGGIPKTDEADDQLNELKTRLLKRRRHLIISHYDDDDLEEDEEELTDEGEADGPLDEDEIQYILDLLNAGHLSEEDAELILGSGPNKRIPKALGL